MVPASDAFSLLAIALGVVFVSERLEKLRFGRYLSSVVWVIVLGVVLANAGLVPHEAPAYTLITTYLVPLAIPLMLVEADLPTVFRKGGRTLVAFMIGAAGTLIGTAAAFATVDLGSSGDKLAGMFAATYIGGSMNIVAVAEATELNDAALFAAALAADNLAGTLYLVLLAFLAGQSWVARHFGAPVQQSAAGPEPRDTADSHSGSLLPPLVFSGLICAAGHWLATQLGAPAFAILWITLLSVIAVNIAPGRFRALRGGFRTGMLFMSLFFFVIGAGADVSRLAGSAVSLLMFAGIVLAVHFAVIASVGRMLGVGIAELAIGSNACVLGPGPAAAMAAGNRWHTLITPALLCGVFGYVIANFLGVGIAWWLGSQG